MIIHTICLYHMMSRNIDDKYRHVSIKIWSFTIHLCNRSTSRFKIYKDLYSCLQDLWLVAGPSNGYLLRK